MPADSSLQDPRPPATGRRIARAPAPQKAKYPHAARTPRSAAALLGVPAAWGYFAFCGAGALAIRRPVEGGRGSWSEESAGIGVFQASALAVGFLFVSLYGGVLGDLESLLFGNLLGISDGQVLVL